MTSGYLVNEQICQCIFLLSIPCHVCQCPGNHVIRVHVWCLEVHDYCPGVYDHRPGICLSALSINCIGVPALIPFVVTVLLIFLASKVFGYRPSMVTTRLIVTIVITIGMTISICQSIPLCVIRPLSLI